MKMADRPERTPADPGTNDPTFVYRNEITRLKQQLAASQAHGEAMKYALYAALPFVEDAEIDDGYKPGAVTAVLKKIRAALLGKS